MRRGTFVHSLFFSFSDLFIEAGRVFVGRNRGEGVQEFSALALSRTSRSDPTFAFTGVLVCVARLAADQTLGLLLAERIFSQLDESGDGQRKMINFLVAQKRKGHDSFFNGNDLARSGTGPITTTPKGRGTRATQ